MLFNVALFAGVLCIPEALAIPSQLATRSSRREGHQPQIYDELEGSAGDVTNTGWAGAGLAESNGTFQTVTGTFAVPTPSSPVSGSNWASAAVWVGIDGSSCQNAILQTGIDLTVKSGQVSYDAWYEWYPDPSYTFSGISISAGDVIKLTVTATSTTSGTATIENLTNSQTVSKSLTSTYALCQQDAEWIVEDYMISPGQVPFADFGTVTFTDTEASGARAYTPSGATIFEIQQNGKSLTSVSTSNSSVTIKYV